MVRTSARFALPGQSLIAGFCASPVRIASGLFLGIWLPSSPTVLGWSIGAEHASPVFLGRHLQLYHLGAKWVPNRRGTGGCDDRTNARTLVRFATSGWVTLDAQRLIKAKRLLRHHHSRSARAGHPVWKCSICRQSVKGTFQFCPATLEGRGRRHIVVYAVATALVCQQQAGNERSQLPCPRQRGKGKGKQQAKGSRQQPDKVAGGEAEQSWDLPSAPQQ